MSPEHHRDYPPRPSARHFALIVGLAFTAYASNLGNQFAMDDAYNVVSNERIRSLTYAVDYFFSAWGGAASGYEAAINTGYYRPVSELSFAVDYATYGLSPTGFHFTNDLIHALNSALVLALCAALGIRVLSSMFAAAVFAVHPVHSEAVHLITYRTELLSCLFGLMALVAYLRISSLWQRLLVTSVLYALGLLSKESVVTLPAWIALLDLQRSRSIRSVISHVAPMAAVLALYLGIRHVLLTPSEVRFFNLGGSSIAASMMSVYSTYIRLLVWPWPLTPFYDWGILPPVDSFFAPAALVGVVWLLVSIGCVPLAWKKKPLLALGVAWWLLGLIPFSHIIPLPVGAAERFLYFPSIGAVVLMGAMLPVDSATRWNRWICVLVCILVTLFGGLTTIRALDWRDDETLLLATRRDFPESINAPMALGQLYCERGDVEEAVEAFMVLERRVPAFYPNIERWVNCLQRHGQNRIAAKVIQEARARRHDERWELLLRDVRKAL